MDLSPGDRVDRYVLCEPLGEGGQGAVWKAQDPLAGDVFRAIKLVSVAGTRPNDTERLRREARALARLSHTSLLKSHALFEDLPSGVLGIVMDYVEGASLRVAQGDPRFTAELGAFALAHIARALAYVHEAGVTHRDLKLENVLVTSAFWSAPHDGANVKLVDFGIAKDVGAQHGLTAIDTVVGTLAYLAPELIDPGYFAGQTSAPAVDVFAFGVLGYKLLVGPHPSGLPPSASIVDYAAVYRRSVQDRTSWPPRIGQGPWAELLRDCLVLTQSARLRDGNQLVERIDGIPRGTACLAGTLPPEAPVPTSIASPHAALAPTEALVAIPGRAEPPIPLAPSMSGSATRREAATVPLEAVPAPPAAIPSAVTPAQVPIAMSASSPVSPVRLDASSAHGTSSPAPVQTTARAVTVSEQPPTAPAGPAKALVWTVVGTLVSIAAVIAYRALPWASWMSRADQPPEKLVFAPSAPVTSLTPIAPIDKLEKADARPETSTEPAAVRTVPAECDAGSDAGPCPCCPSGQDCEGSCDAPVPQQSRWLLRLGHVEKTGKNLLDSHPRGQVCARIDAVGKRAVCTNLTALASGTRIPSETLEVTGEDFERYGLDVTVQDVTDDGRVPAPVVQAHVPRHSLLRKVLCEGVVVDTSKQSDEIDRVVLYLDLPGATPHRCILP